MGGGEGRGATQVTLMAARHGASRRLRIRNGWNKRPAVRLLRRRHHEEGRGRGGKPSRLLEEDGIVERIQSVMKKRRPFESSRIGSRKAAKTADGRLRHDTRRLCFKLKVFKTTRRDSSTRERRLGLGSGKQWTIPEPGKGGNDRANSGQGNKKLRNVTTQIGVVSCLVSTFFSGKVICG